MVGRSNIFMTKSSRKNVPDSSIDWLCWGLTTRQPLWVILCRLPEKGRKVIEEIVEEIKERDREERNRNESEETEEIKIFPIYPYLLQG